MSLENVAGIETSVYIHYLPPNISPEFYKYTRYINSPPFKTGKSYEKSLKKIGKLTSENPESILRSVRIGYIARRQVKNSKEDYTLLEETSFQHPEITSRMFLELLKCCDPAKKTPLKDVEQCWNKVFPGNLSNFNLYVPTLKDLDPETAENIVKYYPPYKPKVVEELIKHSQTEL